MSGQQSSRSSLGIVCSPSAGSRLEAAHQFINAFAPSDELLIVGETRDAVDDFAREIVTRRGALFGLYRFSLRQLASTLAATELARRGLAVASPLSTEAVSARSAFESLASNGLDYLAPVARLRSIGQTLAATLGDLRDADVDLASLDDHGARGADVSVLARRFDEQLSQADLVDRSVLFRLAARSARGNVAGPIGGPLLLLDVAIRDEVTRRLVQALCGRASHALATVPEGDDRSLSALTEVPGAQTKPPSPPPRVRDADDLERVRRYLFASERLPEPSPRSDGDPAVRFFSAPGENRECVEIARAALREAANGVPFDRMAILVRAPELYSGLVETALTRAGIAGWFSRGTRVPDPAGRAYLTLLACASERLSARRFAEYLSLAQVPFLSDEGTPPSTPAPWVPPDNAATDLPRPAVPTQLSLFDGQTAEPPEPTDNEDQPVVAGSLRTPAQWDRLLVESAVIGGRDRWARRLDGLAHELRVRRDERASEEPESPRTRALDRDLKNLDHLRRFALPVIDRLAELPEQGTWGEWLVHLEALAPMVLKQPDRVLSVLAELRPMARVGPIPLDEVRDVLSGRLTALQADPPSRRYGMMFIGRPEQVRGRHFDVVFVPGLAERLFPQKQRQDPLLLDDVRLAINERASTPGSDRRRHGLLTQDDRASEERLLLRLAVGAATRRLYLSYPRLQLSESRLRVPSFYALDIERARRGRVPDFPTLAREAYQQATARLAWPAPEDPNVAIDDTEHDLSVLGPLLAQEVTPRLKGRARYLLRLNPGLRRSLLTRWARWKRPWSRFDGLYDMGDDAKALLAAHRVSARPYSVSALQRFAMCPYQFLLSAIYRLEPREEIEPLERMDPLTRGRMFHEVQAEFIRELQRRDALPVTLGQMAGAEEVIDSTLDRVAASYHEDLAPAIDRVWADEVEAMRADLKGWVHRMGEEDADWIPIHAEFGFGFDGGHGRDPDSVQDPVRLDGKWQLHGVVDLIDAPAGPTRDGELRVTDHKTGRNRAKERMVTGHGEVLQPVLYGLAVEQALGRPVQTSRLFFCTLPGGFASRPVSLGPEERRQGIEVLEIVDRAVAAGELLPAPRKGACGWCDFREVCGPWEEKRVGWKDRSKLGDLLALRRMP